MEIAAWVYIMLGVYVLSLSCIFIYSLGQLHLLFLFLKHRKNVKVVSPLEGDDLPFVTIQLPIYNERYVVERLLEACAAQDYPQARFEIQLLDDSTDDTVDLAASKIKELQERGYQVSHVRRPERTGYKAGALAYGLAFVQGDFVAIFDADFLPKASYLRNAMAQFTEEEIGVVQARWEHVNQSYSLFTEVQAFQLDAHFTIEQFGRNVGGMCINFNGTAGVWRVETIADAGGWQADTLTEDLDLSYRAQLKGWKFRYIDCLGAPAELPAEMGAIKSQQYRWMKGGAEVARKLLSALWTSSLSFPHKFHGTLHLLSSSLFLAILVQGLVAVPMLYTKYEIFNGQVDFLLAPVFLLFVSFSILGVYYFATIWHREGGNLKRTLLRWGKHFIPFLGLSMGLSIHNSVAVIQGFAGKKTPFIRTPKFNLLEKGDSWKHVSYKHAKVSPSTIGELLMALYFGLGVYFCFKFDDMAVFPYLLIQGLGFAAIGFFSLRHALMRTPK